MARMPGVPFKPPRSYTTGRPGGPPRLIVIHYTAGSEGPTAAEDGVAYDARRTDGTSAHFYTDRDSIIQCVDTANRSHTALYNGNLYGIHIEMCGTVQTAAQWMDAASRETIRNTAKVCLWAMKTHGIPLVRLVGRQVRTGRGICGHIDCTTGFPEDGGTHTDPGVAFPWGVLFDDIKQLQEDPMALDLGTKIAIDTDIAALTGGVYKVGEEVSLERFLEVIFHRADAGSAAGHRVYKAIADAAAAEATRDAAEAARESASDADIAARLDRIEERLSAGGVTAPEIVNEFIRRISPSS
jgi:N-acetyl-anhydromuramyl-L-alanine amidase AmpD